MSSVSMPPRVQSAPSLLPSDDDIGNIFSNMSYQTFLHHEPIAEESDASPPTADAIARQATPPIGNPNYGAAAAVHGQMHAGLPLPPDAQTGLPQRPRTATAWSGQGGDMPTPDVSRQLQLKLLEAQQLQEQAQQQQQAAAAAAAAAQQQQQQQQHLVSSGRTVTQVPLDMLDQIAQMSLYAEQQDISDSSAAAGLSIHREATPPPPLPQNGSHQSLVAPMPQHAMAVPPVARTPPPGLPAQAQAQLANAAAAAQHAALVGPPRAPSAAIADPLSYHKGGGLLPPAAQDFPPRAASASSHLNAGNTMIDTSNFPPRRPTPPVGAVPPSLLQHAHAHGSSSNLSVGSGPQPTGTPQPGQVSASASATSLASLHHSNSALDVQAAAVAAASQAAGLGLPPHLGGSGVNLNGLTLGAAPASAEEAVAQQQQIVQQQMAVQAAQQQQQQQAASIAAQQHAAAAQQAQAVAQQAAASAAMQQNPGGAGGLPVMQNTGFPNALQQQQQAAAAAAGLGGMGVGASQGLQPQMSMPTAVMANVNGVPTLVQVMPQQMMMLGNGIGQAPNGLPQLQPGAMQGMPQMQSIVIGPNGQLITQQQPPGVGGPLGGPQQPMLNGGLGGHTGLNGAGGLPGGPLGGALGGGLGGPPPGFPQPGVQYNALGQPIPNANGLGGQPNAGLGGWGGHTSPSDQRRQNNGGRNNDRYGNRNDDGGRGGGGGGNQQGGGNNDNQDGRGKKILMCKGREVRTVDEAAALGGLLELAHEQNGCRFLQDQLDLRVKAHIDLIFEAVGIDVVPLAMDPFGNYLIQKLVQYGTVEQRVSLVNGAAPSLITIALNVHGTRVVQKMIEV